MKMLVLATAAAVALAFTAPAFTTPAVAQDASVKVKVKSHEGMTKKKIMIRHGDRGRHEGWRHRDVKKVVIHHDRGLHRGFSHSRHYGYGGASKVVIKKGHGKTVIKKKFEG